MSRLSRIRRRSAQARRYGFTLLELFLTLSLAVVLMTLVNQAFRFYAVEMDSSDSDMRRTMLAAAVMQMIEDDLRASLHPEPLDTAALETLLSSTAASASGGGNTGGGAAASSGGGAAAAGTEDPATEDDSIVSDSSSSLSVLQTPGLIGSQYQLQIDTSRLPRLEEYAVLMDVDPGNLADLPSDLKTVTYYVQPADALLIEDPLAKLDASTPAQAGGLVRRVLDRSATTFASMSGNLSALSQTGELLAPEVTGIEFSYWDGVTWQIEWNSDSFGELPMAIKIQMSMVDPMVDVSEQEVRVFQHIVKLPMAKFIEEEEEEDLSGVGI